MPIIGLTDQQAALPNIGELRKGAQKKGNAPGKDLDYFRFTSQDEAVIKSFYDEYPQQPRKINAFLARAKAAENFDAWMEEWVAGGLVHRCDGRVSVLHRLPDGSYSTEPKACPGNCKQVGRLAIIIPELGRLATVTVLTTSIHDIKNLMAQLRSYETLTGDLRGVPFEITRRPRQISVPLDGGKRGRYEKWLLSIETQPGWTKRKMLSMESEAMPELTSGDVSPIAAEYTVVEQLPSGTVSPFDEEESGFQGCHNLEDLLFQINQDFGLAEADAKEKLKELGYSSFPADGNGTAKDKSKEMYLAVKAAL